MGGYVFPGCNAPPLILDETEETGLLPYQRVWMTAPHPPPPPPSLSQGLDPPVLLSDFTNNVKEAGLWRQHMINFPNHNDKTVPLGENNLVTLFRPEKNSCISFHGILVTT